MRVHIKYIWPEDIPDIVHSTSHTSHHYSPKVLSTKEVIIHVQQMRKLS